MQPGISIETSRQSGEVTRIEWTKYDGDASGFRIRRTTNKTIYLTDPQNETGDAQTLRESTFDAQRVLTPPANHRQIFNIDFGSPLPEVRVLLGLRNL